MKIFPFLLSLWITSAFAQDDTSWEVNHYEQTRTFVKDGYTYQCDLNDRIFMSYVSGLWSPCSHRSSLKARGTKRDGKLSVPLCLCVSMYRSYFAIISKISTVPSSCILTASSATSTWAKGALSVVSANTLPSLSSCFSVTPVAGWFISSV